VFVRYVLVCAKELLRYTPSRRACISYIYSRYVRVFGMCAGRWFARRSYCDALTLGVCVNVMYISSRSMCVLCICWVC